MGFNGQRGRGFQGGESRTGKGQDRASRGEESHHLALETDAECATETAAEKGMRCARSG
jgi:hypothetical protein